MFHDGICKSQMIKTVLAIYSSTVASDFSSFNTLINKMTMFSMKNCFQEKNIGSLVHDKVISDIQ